MEHTDLGPLRVSRVGLGCNNFGGRLDLAATRRVVDAALDAGIDLFDTADIYGNGGGSERLLGELLQGRRDRVVLATKFGGEMGDGAVGGAPGYVRQALEASLQRLQTDHVDLLYHHFPDDATPIADTVGAMSELLAAGKVRAIGLSNVTADALAEAAATAEIAAVQNEYSLLARDAERDLLPACLELGVGFVPYFPLASGFLTGKYRPGEAAEGSRLGTVEEGASVTRRASASFATIERLQRFAEEQGHSLLELAIAGLASRPGVASVIAGATKPEQVRANAAAGDWQLTADQLAALDALAGQPSR
ncbi:MAG TPA: aldo/keto reductase [Gaiellales bacterium]|jgi:aryl-alcohol dehydrogenase-like predicted oxidoreductase|nr:aldo/keto reductase [Gaiellales bacterium]